MCIVHTLAYFPQLSLFKWAKCQLESCVYVIGTHRYDQDGVNGAKVKYLMRRGKTRDGEMTTKSRLSIEEIIESVCVCVWER